jgi:hypothetical protein
VKFRFYRRAAGLLALSISAAVVSEASGKELLEEIVERNYPINPDAKFSIRNSDGSIRIYGADVSQMKLQAIKKAYTKNRLHQIGVNVAVQPGLVTIDTTQPPKPKWGFSDRSGTVDYVIILPWYCDVQKVELETGELLVEGMRGNEVHARLGSGRMFGHNCFTDLHLWLGNGGLDVAYDWWESDRIALDSSINQGNTRVFIPGDAQFRLQAQTSEGHIITDFVTAEERPSGNQTKLNLSIGNSPSAEMNVRADDGSIIIKEANL